MNRGTDVSRQGQHAITDAPPALEAAPPVRRSAPAWRSVMASMGAKVVVMSTTAVAGLLTARLILEHFGVQWYAQYGLVAGLAALVPFADLGLSAAVINAVSASDNPKEDPELRPVLLGVLRLLLVSALVFVAITLVFTALDLWPTLLGDGLSSQSNLVVMVCGLIFAVSVPLGVGQRILTGLGRNHVQILLQGLAAPLILAGVALVMWQGWSGRWLPVFTYLASGVVAAAALLVSWRYLGPQLARTLLDVPRIWSAKGARVFDVAWPMLVMSVALPIAMQTARLLLSHRGTAEQLAEYNIAAQLFNLIIQVAVAAGMALWPIFALSRARGEARSPMPLTAAFGGAALVLGLVLALLQPWAVAVISDGQLHLSWLTVTAFVWLVVAQSIKWPLGMYMTDAPGLRFQVWRVLVMVPLSIVFSWYLIPYVGASGPVFGSALAVTVCQVFPNATYVRRDVARRRVSTERIPA